MSQPQNNNGGPDVVHVPAPLGWQIGHGVAPDGTKLCVLAMTQGLLTVQVTLNPYDLDKLGRQCQQQAAQARSGLILPGSANAPRIGDGGQPS